MTHAGLTIRTFVDASFGENALVVHANDAEGRGIAWIVDPGFRPQVDHLLAYVAEHGLTVEKIVLTHGHADHIAGLDVVRAAWPDAPVLLAEPDQAMLQDANANLSAPFGLAVTVKAGADEDLPPGRELALGAFRWDVLDTSGHSPGGRSLYCAEAGVVIAGDALFAGSIGRTDFSGCDHERLIRNIRTQLFALPPDTVVYPGHGPTTTIENERKFNPFVADR